MTPQEAESKAIDYLRIPLAIGVIIIHMNMCKCDWIINYAHPFRDLDFYSLFTLFFTNKIGGIAVPLFFLISGYLFFYHLKEWNLTTYQTKIKKRVKSLFIPYLIFCLLAIISLTINMTLLENHDLLHNIRHYFELNQFLHSFWDVHPYAPMPSIWGYFTPKDTPINVPMWFMRDLMIMALCSGLIHWLIKKGGKGFIILLLLCYVTNTWFPVNGTRGVGGFFFCLGAYFSINGLSMAQSLWKWRRTITASTLLLLIADLGTQGHSYCIFIHQVYLIGGVLSSLIVSTWIILRYNPNIPKYVGEASFFIYATHTVSLPYMRRPVEFAHYYLWTHPDNTLLAVLEFIAVAAVSTAICLVLFFVMRKCCPGLLNFLTGKRKQRA